MQARAKGARQHAAALQQQLWQAQYELGDLDKLRLTHQQEERTPDEERLFTAIMDLGARLQRPLRPDFIRGPVDPDGLGWVQDEEVLHL